MPVVIPITGTGWAVTVTTKLVIILNPITKAAVIEATNAIVLSRRTISFFDNVAEYLLLSFICYLAYTKYYLIILLVNGAFALSPYIQVRDLRIDSKRRKES